MKPSAKKADTPSLNVLAYIRIRPLGDKEKFSTNLEFTKKDVTFKNSSKTLTFDRVFDDTVKQVCVYTTVVKPMIKEVLLGYNCTVFAYGQTGTGKTYTITGEQGDSMVGLWEDNMHAGIIPRAMEEIFTELSKQHVEYQVSISYMELYNEKLRSLLKESDEDTNIQLIDDLEGGVVYKGHLPTPVMTKEEAFGLLQLGAERRQVASTLMNHNSSRSHTIFTITVNIKENGLGDKDDVLRIGKLHLVDLAGSENVSKSGASDKANKAGGVNRRLTEASNINKSLLTLGRVITSLIENSQHIPYRESKLTRLLRDSLGGKTKTCIIGTISPAQCNLEETESTLNYAYKARSIKNKPEKNQKISKKEFMQVASEEITKLKRDLEAVRQGEGFYISKESHEEMSNNMKELNDKARIWNDRFDKLNESFEQHKLVHSSLSIDYDDKCAEYDELERNFTSEMTNVRKKIDHLEKELVVREYLIEEYQKTEDKLTDQAKTCKSVLENLMVQSGYLHDKIERKNDNEAKNCRQLEEFKTKVTSKINMIKNDISEFINKEKDFTSKMSMFTGIMMENISDENRAMVRSLESFKEQIELAAQVDKENVEKMGTTLADFFSGLDDLVRLCTNNEINEMKTFLYKVLIPSADSLKENLKRTKPLFLHGFEMIEELQSLEESLKVEASILESKISQTTCDILEDCDTLETNLNEASAEVKSSDEKCGLALEKCGELQEMLKSIQESMANTDKTLHNSRQATGEIGGKIKDFIAKSNEEGARKHLLLSKQIHNSAKSASKVIGELFDLDSAMEPAQIKVIGAVQTQFNKGVENLEKGLKLQECEIRTVKRQATVLRKEFEVQIQKTASTSNEFVDKIIGKSKEFEDNMDKYLRKENAKILHNEIGILEFHETHSESVGDAIREVDNLTYVSDAPLGMTPPRESLSQLSYPRTFESTAPKDILMARFRDLNISDEELQQSSISSSTRSKPSPEPGDREALPDTQATEQPTVASEITPQRVLRRSTSLPDVSAPESSYGHRDKENIPRSERPLKMKKPAKILKKKTSQPLREVNTLCNSKTIK